MSIIFDEKFFYPRLYLYTNDNKGPIISTLTIEKIDYSLIFIFHFFGDGG